MYLTVKMIFAYLKDAKIIKFSCSNIFPIFNIFCVPFRALTKYFSIHHPTFKKLNTGRKNNTPVEAQ
jgi:hypothetical protein